jgi:hypothetical protein
VHIELIYEEGNLDEEEGEFIARGKDILLGRKNWDEKTGPKKVGLKKLYRKSRVRKSRAKKARPYKMS